MTKALGAVRSAVFEFPDAVPPYEAVVALMYGNTDTPNPLVRVHSRCLYGEVFGSLECDCLAQIEMAWEVFRIEGAGILVYLEQEGRGCGLLNKARAYRMHEDQALDTVDAYQRLGLPLDARQYVHAAAALARVGHRKVRLLTNNPAKVAGLVQAGIDVERVPIQTAPTAANIEYLEVKAHKLSHYLDTDVDRPPPATKPRVVVLGGAVTDVMLRIPQMPAWGEAVQAHAGGMSPGGKGLNQAIAAARMGADVSLITAIGDDQLGIHLRDAMIAHGINHDHVRTMAGAVSPLTAVFVNDEANAAFIGWKNSAQVGLTRDAVAAAEELIESADALLISLEIPLDAVMDAVRVAKRGHTRVMLNPAPPLDPPERLSDHVLRDVDILIPNIWEAYRLVGRSPGLHSTADLARLAADLGSMGVGTVAITTGADGCVTWHGGAFVEHAGFMTNPLDTSGGSDAFCAAFGLAILGGKSVSEAAREANAAGALSVGMRGAAASMPSADDVTRYLASHRDLAMAGHRA